MNCQVKSQLLIGVPSESSSPRAPAAAFFRRSIAPLARVTTALFVAFAAFGANGAAAAEAPGAETIAQSGPDRVTLVELYSSEGCDSCPPADTWLSTLKNKSGLWKRFIPLAFQVDYWDSLGWKDILAKREFTERQRAYARELGSAQIYTPEIISDGKEWHGWRNGEAPLESRPLKNSGVLKIERVGPKFRVVYTPLNRSEASNLSLHLATLGMSVAHAVTRGENRGHELKHDFIVLDLKTRQGQSKNGVVEAEFESAGALVSGDQPAKAIAAWVTEPGALQALQATGGPLTHE